MYSAGAVRDGRLPVLIPVYVNGGKVILDCMFEVGEATVSTLGPAVLLPQ